MPSVKRSFLLPAFALSVIVLGAGLMLRGLIMDEEGFASRSSAEGSAAGVSAAESSIPVKPAAEPAPPVTAEPAMDSSLVVEAYARSELADLSSNLAFLPDDGGWSRVAEKRISALIADDESFEWASEKILASDVECRATACRVSLRVADLMDADELSTQLQLMMGDEFSKSRSIPVALDDGTQEIHVFAVTRGGEGLLKTGRPPPAVRDGSQAPRL